jgi:hypothetical protein
MEPTVKTTKKQDEPRNEKPVELRKILDQKLDQIQKLTGLHTRLTNLQGTLLKIKEFKYTSTRTNEYLRLRDGENHGNEFTTSNIHYVEKVRDFLIQEMKKDIEATEAEIQAATL